MTIACVDSGKPGRTRAGPGTGRGRGRRDGAVEGLDRVPVQQGENMRELIAPDETALTPAGRPFRNDSVDDDRPMESRVCGGAGRAIGAGSRTLALIPLGSRRGGRRLRHVSRRVVVKLDGDRLERADRDFRAG